MGVRFPLGIRINDGRVDRFVTADASNLRWKRTAPGGFHSMSVSLNIDPSLFPDLGASDRIWVYGPTGSILFQGFLDNPGKSADQGGVGLDLTAMGTVVLAQDQARPLPYLEKTLDGWSQNQASSAASGTSANVSTSDDPTMTATTTGGDVPQGLLTQLNPGQPIVTGTVAQVGYSALANAGMELGVVGFSVKSGITDTNYRDDIIYSSGPGTAAVLTVGTTSTTPANLVRYVGASGSFPAGQNRVAFQLRRTGAATNVANDDTWSWFYNVSIVARRMSAAGVLLDAATLQAQGGAGSVRADYIVADLVGRMLSVVDPNMVQIDAASFAIDQLSYTEPVTVADVLDDLEQYEPDFLWEFLGATSNGYVFNYRAWPTTVRYEVSTRDGYEAPGGEFELCNRIAIKWTDAKGKDRTTIVTAASAPGAFAPGGVTATVFAPALSALEQQGRTRDAESITLPEGRGSASNAQRIGEQTLAAKASPPKAATVTVKRSIPDLLRGGVAAPYEVRPGYLCRVRETGDVLRVTEVEVDDEAGVAVMTLGEPLLDDEARIARLDSVRRRRAA